MAIFVIGLPSTLRAAFIAEARRQGENVGTCIVVKSHHRYLFNPPSEQVIRDLEHFADQHDWESLTIIALPYVPWPEGVKELLDFFASSGVKVVRPQLGLDDWPARLVGQHPDDDFTNDIRLVLFRQLGWEANVLLADRFRRSAERMADYLILGAALDRCDEVHASRHNFLKRSAEMLEKFCRKKGQLGTTLEAFFGEKGIAVAHSGGISTCIRLMRGARQLARYDSNLHLKEGDATSEIAAARIYFQHLDRSEQFRLFLLYAGPHPSDDISQHVEWIHD